MHLSVKRPCVFHALAFKKKRERLLSFTILFIPVSFLSIFTLCDVSFLSDFLKCYSTRAPAQAEYISMYAILPNICSAQIGAVCLIMIVLMLVILILYLVSMILTLLAYT